MDREVRSSDPSSVEVAILWSSRRFLFQRWNTESILAGSVITAIIRIGGRLSECPSLMAACERDEGQLRPDSGGGPVDMSAESGLVTLWAEPGAVQPLRLLGRAGLLARCGRPRRHVRAFVGLIYDWFGRQYRGGYAGNRTRDTPEVRPQTSRLQPAVPSSGRERSSCCPQIGSRAATVP